MRRLPHRGQRLLTGTIALFDPTAIFDGPRSAAECRKCRSAEGGFAPAAGPRIGLDHDVVDDANDATSVSYSLALAREVASFAMTQCRKCRKCRNIFAEPRKACLARCGRGWTSSPSGSLKRLGLPLGKPVKVRYADGRQANRHRAEGVSVVLLGRHGTLTAVVEPGRQTAPVGAIVLEDLDLLVDCVGPRVVPRDPGGEFRGISLGYTAPRR